MRVSIAGEPSTPGAVNLDWAGAHPRLAVVLDGLTESPQTGCVHGTAWYVARLGARLLRRLDGPTPLADGLALAVEEVAAEHPGCDLRHPRLARLDRLDRAADATGRGVLVLADSPVVLDTVDGPVAVIDDSWKALATPDLAAAADRGTRDDLARFIADQQGQRNTPGGYWIARTEPEAAGARAHRHGPGVSGAVLASDGAALLVTDYGLLDWRGYLDLGYREGPAGIIAATRTAERADPTEPLAPARRSATTPPPRCCLFDATRQEGATP